MANLDDLSNIDPTSVSVKPVGNKWGLIWGLVSVALSMVVLMTNKEGAQQSMFSIPSLLSYVVAFGMIFMGIKEMRDQHLGGNISLGKAFGLAMWMALIAGIISLVFFFVYLQFIDPNFMQRMTETAIDQAENKGQDPEQVKKGMEMMSFMFSPIAMGVFALIGKTFAGLIWGLLAGLILKKEPARPF